MSSTPPGRRQLLGVVAGGPLEVVGGHVEEVDVPSARRGPGPGGAPATQWRSGRGGRRAHPLVHLPEVDRSHGTGRMASATKVVAGCPAADSEVGHAPLGDGRPQAVGEPDRRPFRQPAGIAVHDLEPHRASPLPVPVAALEQVLRRGRAPRAAVVDVERAGVVEGRLDDAPGLFDVVLAGEATVLPSMAS